MSALATEITPPAPTPAIEPKGVRPLSLRRNFLGILAGNISYAFCQWAVLIILAKLGSPEMLGRFALALAITTPVIMFANLQLRSVQATDTRRNYASGDYLGLRLATTILALTIIGCVAAFFSRAVGLVIVLVGFSKAFEAISDAIYGIFQREERLDRMATSMLMKGPATLLAMGLVLRLTDNLAISVGAMTCVWALLLFVYDLPVARRITAIRGESLQPRWNWSRLFPLAWMSLPLGVVTLLGSMNTNIPRYFMAEVGERELGIFAALAYTHIAGARFLVSMCRSAEYRLAQSFAEGRHDEYRAVMIKVVGLALAVGLAGVLAASLGGRQILTLLYGPVYAKYTTAFLLVMCASACAHLAMGFQQCITSARMFRTQAVLTSITAACVFTAACLLVPRYGLNGGAIALMIAAFIDMTASAMVVAALVLNPDKRHAQIGLASEIGGG